LTCIQSNAFYSSSLKLITILRHVQILCSSCFLSCKSLSSISFELDCHDGQGWCQEIRIRPGCCWMEATSYESGVLVSQYESKKLVDSIAADAGWRRWIARTKVTSLLGFVGQQYC
jgi:hypothetical protein